MTTVQLKVTLLGIEPPIWRRLIVDGSATLAQFHEVLQVAMGWGNVHLHAFEINGTRYASAEDDDFEEEDVDEAAVTLDRVFANARNGIYEYDFGDGWEHEVEVENIYLDAMPDVVASCIDGERACPPEDCGGTTGYEQMLNVLADKGHDERAANLEWLGSDFDPNRFDAGEANQKLTEM